MKHRIPLEVVLKSSLTSILRRQIEESLRFYHEHGYKLVAKQILSTPGEDGHILFVAFLTFY